MKFLSHFIAILTIWSSTAIVNAQSHTQDSVANDYNDSKIIPGEFEDHYKSQFRLKTNALGWALLQSNIEAEIDLHPHWSFNLPVYYSALNYFTFKWKFRIIGIRPEFRYWIKENNSDWFVGLHFGIAGYDFAFGGDYRFQSDWRKTPAIGGGVTVGYRMPISKNRRWEMEFALGIGVYSLKYNRFENHWNAKPFDTVKKTFIGPDCLAISFSYAFDLKKGGDK